MSNLEYKLAWYKTKRLANANKAFDLLGRACVQCGSTEYLQFDHISPETKKFNIGAFLHRKWEFLVDELAKCQILCRSCNLNKTNQEKISKRQHGTRTMYIAGGCRCSDCRTAERNAKRIQKGKPLDTPLNKNKSSVYR